MKATEASPEADGAKVQDTITVTSLNGDGEKTEVEKTLVFKAGCSKITFRTALSAFIAMKITVDFSYSLPPPNA